MTRIEDKNRKTDMKRFALTCLSAAMLSGGFSAPASADVDPFMGTIQAFGANFCPRGWAPANGQLLAISSHSALFSLLGTMYGGDGRNNFALPDLRGRMNMHAGHGPGLTPQKVGGRGGLEEVYPNIQTMANHTHTLGVTISSYARASKDSPSTNTPSGGYVATHDSIDLFAAASDPLVAMGPNSADFTISATAGASGGSQPLYNVQPVLGMITCIALEGRYPSRS